MNSIEDFTSQTVLESTQKISIIWSGTAKPSHIVTPLLEDGSVFWSPSDTTHGSQTQRGRPARILAGKTSRLVTESSNPGHIPWRTTHAILLCQVARPARAQEIPKQTKARTSGRVRHQPLRKTQHSHQLSTTCHCSTCCPKSGRVLKPAAQRDPLEQGVGRRLQSPRPENTWTLPR